MSLGVVWTSLISPLPLYSSLLQTCLGFIKGAESIPVLISIPLTGFLNDVSLTQGKAGYYICSALVAVSGVLMFFIGFPKNTSKMSMNG